MKPTKALLVLEDGTTFEGAPFGAVGEAVGETVFYTGVVGYQEVITSPSYRGTLAVLTYPIIGSYGINDEDNESPAPQASGVVIRDYSRHYSNFRATGALEPFLQEHGIVGIQGVDTRALAVHLREHGEQRGIIASGSGLDEAPELTEDMRLAYAGRSLISVGSKAVLNVIERHRPLLGLFGHIHEGKGTRKYRRTLCINPGSMYEQGILHGAVVELKPKKVGSYILTTG